MGNAGWFGTIVRTIAGVLIYIMDYSSLFFYSFFFLSLSFLFFFFLFTIFNLLFFLVLLLSNLSSILLLAAICKLINLWLIFDIPFFFTSSFASSRSVSMSLRLPYFGFIYFKSDKVFMFIFAKSKGGASNDFNSLLGCFDLDLIAN